MTIHRIRCPFLTILGVMSLIREEYVFEDIKDYLENHNNLLIAGKPSLDERSHFFYDRWNILGKEILVLSREDNGKLSYQYISGGKVVDDKDIDLCMGTPKLLRSLRVEEKNVLVDLASLDHVVIMFITKQLLERVIPVSLFAAYIRPERYNNQHGDVSFSLSSRVMAVDAIPGFARRVGDKQTLCAFLGFEGIRLKGILEAVQNIDRFIPVIAFPTGAPQWYHITMWNNMDTLQSECADAAVLKCYSESIFEAVELLRTSIRPEEKLVLAPLGTRPHSMACAIFACEHEDARIIYDYVVESDSRAIGISEIIIYHLSSFLKT